VPLALRSLLQLDQGDRYGNCEKGRSGQEGRSGEEGRPGQEGCTGEEGRPGQEGGTGEEGRSGQEGGRSEEGCTREEGGAREEGGSQEGCAGQEGGAREEGCTGEEGGGGEEARNEEAGCKEGSKEGGTRDPRCPCCVSACENNSESGGSLAVPDGQQALSGQGIERALASSISLVLKAWLCRASFFAVAYPQPKVRASVSTLDLYCGRSEPFGIG